MKATIQPAFVMRHKSTGRKASCHGAHPATGAPGNTYDDWERVENGFTAHWPDGTIGFGHRPNPATRETAENWLAKMKNFKGWSQM